MLRLSAGTAVDSTTAFVLAEVKNGAMLSDSAGTVVESKTDFVLAEVKNGEIDSPSCTSVVQWMSCVSADVKKAESEIASVSEPASRNTSFVSAPAKDAARPIPSAV